MFVHPRNHIINMENQKLCHICSNMFHIASWSMLLYCGLSRTCGILKLVLTRVTSGIILPVHGRTTFTICSHISLRKSKIDVENPEFRKCRPKWLAVSKKFSVEYAFGMSFHIIPPLGSIGTIVRQQYFDTCDSFVEVTTIEPLVLCWCFWCWSCWLSPSPGPRCLKLDLSWKTLDKKQVGVKNGYHLAN